MSILWDLASPVFGGLIAFVLQHYWQEMNSGVERRKRRRENLEKLAKLSIQQMEYLSAELTRAIFTTNHSRSDVMPEIWAVVELYFPELRNVNYILMKINVDHAAEMKNIFEMRKSNPDKIPDNQAWFDKVYGPGLLARQDFVSACRRLIEEDEAWLTNTWRRRWNWLRANLLRMPGSSKPAE